MPPERAVLVKDCPLGKGVFAARDFEAGEVILRFCGQLVTRRETSAKSERTMDPFQIAPDLFLELTSPSLFLNHSCEPNAAVQEDILLVARRRICADEEIRYDYSTTMSEDIETMACDCKATGCRLIIGSFENLGHHLQATYLGERAVQSFIAHRYRKVENQAA